MWNRQRTKKNEEERRRTRGNKGEQGGGTGKNEEEQGGMRGNREEQGGTGRNKEEQGETAASAVAAEGEMVGVTTGMGETDGVIIKHGTVEPAAFEEPESGVKMEAGEDEDADGSVHAGENVVKMGSGRPVMDGAGLVIATLPEKTSGSMFGPGKV